MAAQVAKKIVSSIDDTGGKTFFRRCGVAFVNSDGSLNVKLDMFPTLKLHIRDEKVEKPVPVKTRKHVIKRGK
ncbi:MAG: hypothetical protein WBV94_08385 [Blastocatellia bacterium]